MDDEPIFTCRPVAQFGDDSTPAVTSVLRCLCLDEITVDHLERGTHTCGRPIHLVIGEPNYGAGMHRRTMAEPPGGGL